MKKNIAVILVGSLIFGSIVKADDSVMSKFIGVWFIDVDKTIEAMKKDPRIAESNFEGLKKGVEFSAGMMTFNVSEKSISFITDMSKIYPNAKMDSMPKSPIFSYSVTKTENNSANIKYSKGSTPVKMTLSLINDKYLKAESLESPEYNNIVWQKDKYIPTPKDSETEQIKDILLNEGIEI